MELKHNFCLLTPKSWLNGSLSTRNVLFKPNLNVSWNLSGFKPTPLDPNNLSDYHSTSVHRDNERSKPFVRLWVYQHCYQPWNKTISWLYYVLSKLFCQLGSTLQELLKFEIHTCFGLQSFWIFHQLVHVGLKSTIWDGGSTAL